MKAIVSAYNFLILALAVVAGAAIGLAFVLIVVDVSLRATGFMPPAFTSAVVEYVLLYFTLFCAPYLLRKKGHVYVDALIATLPPRARRVVEKIAFTICVATSLVFAFIGFRLFFEAIQSGAIEERSIDVAAWISYLPVGPVFVILAIEFGRYLIGLDVMYADRTQAKESL
ncbi:MAG: TRAP transporter small permease [Candidatus Eiseniibacteriota bacterium]